MTTTKRQAKAGGEIGANGSFYRGGTFINTVAENEKGSGSAKIERRPAKPLTDWQRALTVKGIAAMEAQIVRGDGDPVALRAMIANYQRQLEA